MPCAINLIGEGKGASFLVRAYSGGGFLMWTRGLDQSGGSLQHLQVTTEAGTQGGITVLVSATADPDANSYSLNRHSFLIDDVQIGRLFADASWDTGIYFDGSQNPDNTIGVSPGIRAPNVYATSVSGTRQASIYLNKARGAYISADCYIPLNGSRAAMYVVNGSQGVLFAGRSCEIIAQGPTR